MLYKTATTILSLVAILTSVAAAPFEFPLPNGFPTPSKQSIEDIQNAAGGIIPNGPLPDKIDNNTITSFQLIAFNELFEVAYFTELVANITNQVEGYFLYPKRRQFVIDTLNAVIAQEELHALVANTILSTFNVSTIQPCQYQFPVSDVGSAIALAQTFTDVVLGVLNDVEQISVTGLGADAAGYVASLSSVIGQEAQQDGYYRELQGKRPSAQPFLTGGARDFAFTALQGFVVPGSCPSLSSINLRTFEPLTVVTKQVVDGPIEFQAPCNDTGAAAVTIDASSQKLVYINAQNLPVVVDFTVTGESDGLTTFTADFPLDQYVMDGLTIAAVVDKPGPFGSAEEVAAATLFGPGLIEVN